MIAGRGGRRRAPPTVAAPADGRASRRIDDGIDDGLADGSTGRRLQFGAAAGGA